MSGFGDLKYPADFKQFEYVNPNAPKGGLFSQIGSTRQFNQNFLTFNSLNSYIFRGDAALGMELTFATPDEARAATSPTRCTALRRARCGFRADGLTYRFLMRPEAKFHDGSRMTAHDVAWSLNTPQGEGPPDHHPAHARRDGRRGDRRRDRGRALRAEPRPRRAAVRGGAADLLARLLFKAPVRRDHARAAARLRRLQGRQASRPAASSNTIASRTGGAPTCRCRSGRTISTSLRYEFYRDRDVAFEGFTGRNYLFREEFTSRIWATRYNFPAISDGRVKQDVLPDDTPSGAQGWFFNTRREKFKNRAAARGVDPGVRLRMDQQVDHVRVLRPHPFGVPEFQHDGGRASRAPTSLRCSSRSAARCRTKCSASRSCRRSPTARARTARCCARRARSCRRPASPSRTAGA